MGKSKIEWTDATWNPVTGCTKVSAGCKNCYAERVANRLWGKQYGHDILERPPRKFTDVQCHPERLEQPLHWRNPRRIFVNSMSDLFHKDIPDSFILDVIGIMTSCPQHIFQVLTKRPERMLDIATSYSAWIQHEHNHIWLGVSVENQETADERIPLLLKTPAAVHFISYEPALGPVNFRELPVPQSVIDSSAIIERHGGFRFDALTSFDDEHFFNEHTKIDWVICGGESGPGARPCELQWLRSVVAQCRAAAVPCFVKQLGSNPELHGFTGMPLCDRKGGNPDEWPEDLRVREFPHVSD
jgi:protein gp37